MNSIIPSYFNNREYKNVKYPNCGTKIILNPNIRSKDNQIKLINLNRSLHFCQEPNKG